MDRREAGDGVGAGNALIFFNLDKHKFYKHAPKCIIKFITPEIEKKREERGK